LGDGIRNTGHAVLALTTAFYDVMRSWGDDFFDYPQHLALLGADEKGFKTRAGHRSLDNDFFDNAQHSALLGADEEGMKTRAGRLALDDEIVGAAWGGLDVWPDSNWIPAPDTASGMLRKVFDLQINRLFWPENLKSGPDETAFPSYVRKLLTARLKTVYYYATTTPNLEVHVTQTVEDIVQKCIARLPAAGAPGVPRRVIDSADDGLLCVERFRQVGADEFLHDPQFASLWAD
jgi:hypothetical protein